MAIHLGKPSLPAGRSDRPETSISSNRYRTTLPPPGAGRPPRCEIPASGRPEPRSTRARAAAIGIRVRPAVRIVSGQPAGEIEIIDDDGEIADDHQTGHRNQFSRRKPQEKQPQNQVTPDLRNPPPCAKIGLNCSEDGISFHMTSRKRCVRRYDVETGYDNEQIRQNSRRRDQMCVFSANLGRNCVQSSQPFHRAIAGYTRPCCRLSRHISNRHAPRRAGAVLGQYRRAHIDRCPVAGAVVDGLIHRRWIETSTPSVCTVRASVQFVPTLVSDRRKTTNLLNR